MQAITPMRPQPGSSRHAFGRCDVATLQELYDMPDNQTAISTCNDVATRLTLTTSKAAVDRGRLGDAHGAPAGRGLERLSAAGGQSLERSIGEAQVPARRQQRCLADRMDAVAVLLGSLRADISPGARWEFKAVFPAPGDEGLRSAARRIVEVRVRK